MLQLLPFRIFKSILKAIKFDQKSMKYDEFTKLVDRSPVLVLHIHIEQMVNPTYRIGIRCCELVMLLVPKAILLP